MKTLGIDPALATIGWALVENESPIEYGAIKTSSANCVEHRLNEIENSIKSLIENLKPDHVCIETPFFGGLNSNATVLVNALGVIRLAVWRCDIQPEFIAPAQTKKAATGKGNADKKAVRAAIKEKFELQQLKAPDDTFDAIAIGYAHQIGMKAEMYHGEAKSKRKRKKTAS